ncbi:glycosyltransferase family 2 protein [Methanobrevibacter sp.]|uniref:glycosyltransferase family 2 protein n=1 Tax=Methanobrevibacter sp. TaxID=66852 RepID=UPI0038642BCF
MKKLSIICPCFNEEMSINIFYQELIDQISSLNYELIFIDDGSSDDTLSNIKNLADLDENIKFVSFSRNFGKESAIYAGLELSSGDYVVLIDVDLQDPPNYIPEMINIIESTDYDIIATRRVSRKGEPVIRSFFARLFYKIINKVSNLDLVDGARDYRLMTRQVVDSILELNEYNRFSKGLFNWIGFKTKWLEYENIERKTGETSWSFWLLVKYSIEGIVGFTTVPLQISTVFGIIFSLIAFILIIFIVIRKLLYSDPVAGWTSTICVILLLGGIQLFSIGILGKYLEKTYIETKNRPIYIIKETNIE